jgi:protein-tyrosine-phosphatase
VLVARVLFVCVHNAGRSQISQALFNRAAGGAHEARSAGSELAEWADVIVTMGCGDACPYIPGKRYLDWELEDPQGQSIDAVRTTRDEVARRVDRLLAELGTPTPTTS